MVKVLHRLYVGIFVLYLIVPLLVVVVLSFDSARFPGFPLKGVTLRWYAQLVQDSQLIRSIANSFVVALCTVLLALFVGTMTSFALVRYNFPGKNIFYAIAVSPIVAPGAIIGISMLIFLDRFGVGPGLFATVLGQSSFIIAVVMLVVSARLAKFDLGQEEAAMDLGASRWTAIRRVTLPYLRPAFVASAIIAFLMSFDNFNTTLFTIGGERTLPIHLYAMMRFAITPKLNAISVCFIALTVTLGLVVEWVVSRRA